MVVVLAALLFGLLFQGLFLFLSGGGVEGEDVVEVVVAFEVRGAIQLAG